MATVTLFRDGTYSTTVIKISKQALALLAEQGYTVVASTPVVKEN